MRSWTGDLGADGSPRNSNQAQQEAETMTAARSPIVQQAFIDHAALQCGICTPGILVAAKSLLEKHPDPSETEIRYWLAAICAAARVTTKSLRRCRPLPLKCGGLNP